MVHDSQIMYQQLSAPHAMAGIVWKTDAEDVSTASVTVQMSQRRMAGLRRS